MRRGGIRKRLDVHYHLPEYQAKLEKLVARYPEAKRLDDYADVFCGPFGSAISSDDYQEAGIPLLRITNITKEGTIDETDLVFLPEEKAKSLSSTQVEPGDLVISQRGTIGMPAIVPNSYKKWNISANLIAIRGVKILSPSFIQFYLSSSIGGSQIERSQSGQVQGKITTEDVASILIPKTKLESALVAEIETAREAQRKKLSQAGELLSGLDTYLLAQLDLILPPYDNRQTFAARLGDIRNGRIDPHFYHPRFLKLTEAIKRMKYAPLGELVRLSSELWKPEAHNSELFRYVEISSINIRTGEAKAIETLVSEAPSRARMLVRSGDVIVSLTRPHHGAIALIDAELDHSVASTGFAVIRQFDEKRIKREYLWCVLRNRLCLAQMRQRSSGGNYPAISESALKQIFIPVPSLVAQEEIVLEVSKRQKLARRLRREAELEWKAAKAGFERKLLGEEA